MMLPYDPTARPLAPRRLHPRHLRAGGASVRGGADEGGSMMPVVVGLAVALVGVYFAFSSDVGSQAEWNTRYGKS